MVTRQIAVLTSSLAVLIGTASHCKAEEKVEAEKLSARSFFKYAQNREFQGELRIGGKKVVKLRIRTQVKRPCNVCETTALHLLFRFETPFKFPPELRTSTGGFDKVVTLPEIAILSGPQCEGPDVGALNDEIRFDSCKRRSVKGKQKYLVQLISVPATVGFGRRTDEKKRAFLPARIVCEFTIAEKAIHGSVLNQDIQFSLTEKRQSPPKSAVIDRNSPK